MHSGIYDKDCTTWNPSGDIPQIGFVREAVANGTCVVGLRGKKFSVLGGFKKPASSGSEFSTHVEKCFKIDDHCGMAIAGLTADARSLGEYMRLECLEHQYVYESPMPIGRLVAQLGDKAQQRTLYAGRRPYGVGMMIQSYDAGTKKASIHEFCPTGNYYEYVAYSIGDRSQPARTYFERHFETFAEIDDVKQLIKHAVTALHATYKQDTEMTVKNIDISIVGEGQPFKKLTEDELKPYVDEVRAAAGDVAGAGAAMEVDS